MTFARGSFHIETEWPGGISDPEPTVPGSIEEGQLEVDLQCRAWLSHLQEGTSECYGTHTKTHDLQRPSIVRFLHCESRVCCVCCMWCPLISRERLSLTTEIQSLPSVTDLRICLYHRFCAAGKCHVITCGMTA